jgi:hypothetical protein
LYYFVVFLTCKQIAPCALCIVFNYIVSSRISGLSADHQRQQQLTLASHLELSLGLPLTFCISRGNAYIIFSLSHVHSGHRMSAPHVRHLLRDEHGQHLADYIPIKLNSPVTDLRGSTYYASGRSMSNFGIGRHSDCSHRMHLTDTLFPSLLYVEQLGM